MVHGPSNSYIAFGSCKGLVSLKLRPALWIRPFKGLASLKLIYAIWMGLESLKLIHSIVMRPLTAWSTFMNSYLDGLEPYSWIIVLLGWWDFRGSATGDSQNQPIRSNHRTPALHDHDLFFTSVAAVISLVSCTSRTSVAAVISLIIILIVRVNV